MKTETFTFLARDGANTLISLTPDGVLMSGDKHLDALSPEELRQIIRKLVDLFIQMHNTDALSGMYQTRETR